MDQEVIGQKLESLRRCVARVTAKCPPEARSLAADVDAQDAQDIVTLNLSRAIQMCVDIGVNLISSSSDEPVPSTMGQTFQRLGQRV